jgi:hypothetical protein
MSRGVRRIRSLPSAKARRASRKMRLIRRARARISLGRMYESYVFHV